MNKEEIIEELQAQNPWWSNSSLELPEYIIEREIIPSLSSELNKDKITAVLGLRRVGKTTLLKILIKKLLKKIENKRVCYFSFDLAKNIEPRKLIKIYSEEILKKPLSDLNEKIYFFFDEIQKVEDWGNQLKSLYDKNYETKLFITGSSSMNITKGAGESLAGRIILHKIQPFSFKEFLKYKDVSFEEISLDELSYPSNPEKLKISFKEYMETGGLPELYRDSSPELLRQILDLIFFRDIVEIFPVKRTSVLKGIFEYIAENTGQKINYSKISKDLSTEYRTVKDYIEYLEDSFLIEKSRRYEKRTLKKYRKKAKHYISDHSYNNLWESKKGLRAETIAFNHLKKMETPYYNANPEIDIILPKRKLAFEVKYKNKIREKDLKNLLSLPDDFKLFLVTQDKYEKIKRDKREIQLIPLWMLSLTS